MNHLTIFHSSEVDDVRILADGWYIGLADDDGNMTTDFARGPYYTDEAAREALRDGEDWPEHNSLRAPFTGQLVASMSQDDMDDWEAQHRMWAD